MECFKRPKARRPAVATAGCAPGSWETVQGEGTLGFQVGGVRGLIYVFCISKSSLGLIFPFPKLDHLLYQI